MHFLTSSQKLCANNGVSFTDRVYVCEVALHQRLYGKADQQSERR